MLNFEKYNEVRGDNFHSFGDKCPLNSGLKIQYSRFVSLHLEYHKNKYRNSGQVSRHFKYPMTKLLPDVLLSLKADLSSKDAENLCYFSPFALNSIWRRKQCCTLSNVDICIIGHKPHWVFVIDLKTSYI